MVTQDEQMEPMMADTVKMAEVLEALAPLEQPAPTTASQHSKLSSSIAAILDKMSLACRIKKALSLVDRIDRDKLFEKLGIPIREFEAALQELVQARVVQDDQRDHTLYLLLTDEERQEYLTDLARVKRDDRFQVLSRIHDHRTYREDYSSWEQFLHQELCLENPHDWWETEKRRFRIERLLHERGLKLKVPLNKRMSAHLHRVRNDAALFVSCVAEFQSFPEAHQTAQKLGEIVQSHLDQRRKLAVWRESLPDVSEKHVPLHQEEPTKVEEAIPEIPLHLRDEGEPILTSYQANNDFLFAQVARLYFRPGDRIADVTYGLGVFWRQIDVTQYQFFPSDLLTVPERPYDCRHLPYHSEEFDVHVFDPPYMHRPAPGNYPNYQSYATTSGFSHEDILQLYEDGMKEGDRILKPGGLMLVKCKDEMVSKQQRMTHIEIHQLAVNELGLQVEDLFILTQKHSAFNWSIRSPKHARKNHSYLWVFRKASAT